MLASAWLPEGAGKQASKGRATSHETQDAEATPRDEVHRGRHLRLGYSKLGEPHEITLSAAPQANEDCDLTVCRSVLAVASSVKAEGAADGRKGFGGQASKGIRWMPWHQEAKKDVAKLR
jgi:hypothetical protein